jgi:hypothetical protein
MRFAKIKRFIEQKPFRPFIIKTIAGMSVLVKSGDHIKLPPSGSNLMVIYDSDGLLTFFAESDIASAKPKA